MTDTDSLRTRIVEGLNGAHKPGDPLIGDERHDQHDYYSGCYVCRRDVEKLTDALAPVVEDAVASATDRLMDKLRAVMPVGAQWRVVLGPRGAPKYPLAPNTSAFEVAHLLAEARRTWPDAYAESRGVGPWRESDPTETEPTPAVHAARSADCKEQK